MKAERLVLPTQKTELLVGGFPVTVEYAKGRLKPHAAFLGPSGTYTEEAKDALIGFQNNIFDASPLSIRNEEVVRAVDESDFDLGIVAVENSTEGDVTDPLRAIVRADNLTILGETIIPIRHMLIGQEGIPIQEIRSHGQALAQCDRFLTRTYPNARRVLTSSTSIAVEQARNESGVAAVAGRKASETYDVPILAEDIGDNPNNATRFLLIGRGETTPTGNDVTTLLFTPNEERVGVLHECLRILALNGINLNKIDSFPHPTGQMRRYTFLISLDGHKSDPRVAEALKVLQSEQATEMKMLGSYRKALIPEGSREPGQWNGNGN